MLATGASYWCNRRETSEIQARAYTGQRGTRTRMRSIYTACLYCVYGRSLALAVQCETTHGVYEFRRGFCTLVLSLSCVSVCLCVYPSIPALAASASVETSKQQYSRVSLRLFYVWSFEKTFRSKVMAWKSQYANELELTVSRFRAVSGPTKRSSYVKGNWWVV